MSLAMSDETMLHWTWWFLLASLFPQGGVSLKLINISVPQYTLRGEQAQLLCQYDLQSDRLYSVTWYKDHEEFYRYVPRSNPAQLSYKMDGIKVDHQLSDAQKVVIRNVNLKASGLYRCEVSAEAPSFTSVNGEARMEVIYLPNEGPEISGEEKLYQVGDMINLNCTSGKSYPPARLRWFVNDEQVTPDYEVVLQNHGLMTSVSGLRFQVGPEHFLQGRLQVRCVATISTTPTPAPGPPTAPAPSPVLQHHRLSASVPPHHIDYNKEALFLVRGCSCQSAGLGMTFVITMTTLTTFLVT